MHDFSQLEQQLKIAFKNQDLLIQAFCHRSYLNEHPDFRLSHNERLEFLGDAVLELVVTECLYQKYPDKDEGMLTSWRAALVNAKMLAKLAEGLDFGKFLLLSQGEARENHKSRQYILANTFESFIGALYMDQGIRKAGSFIKSNVLPELDEIIKQGSYRDAKSNFQEEAQERVGVTPTYEVIKEWGPDHAKHFQVAVLLGEERVAEGQGTSKQEAEESAARNGLHTKGW